MVTIAVPNVLSFLTDGVHSNYENDVNFSDDDDEDDSDDDDDNDENDRTTIVRSTMIRST